MLWLPVAAVAFPVTVTVQSLLGEMHNLDRLAWPANYSAAQASSYDRAAKDPNTNWFANGDAGKFLRIEERDGRKEHVMADLQGPGAVLRIWSANPNGVARFYFDGEPTPRLASPLGDLLRGKVPPFGDEFAYESSRGCNLYFPLPYAKSLKITVDESGPINGLYYQVGYRTYTPGTAVESFPGLASLEIPEGFEVRSSESKVSTADGRIAPRSSLTLNLDGGGVVEELVATIDPSAPSNLPWNSPQALHNVLRALVLLIEVDGETTVVAPLGDFFATAPGLVPFKSQPMEVAADGTLTCRLPMPFSKAMSIKVENRGAAPARLALRASVYKPLEMPPYRLHAQWEYDRGHTRPMRDLKLIDAAGEGRFVGTFLHVENPTPSWWGEGDEKVYVDGEAFPSTFGTGTEDYFGYAWCCPIPFLRPWHGQARCDGPGNYGHTTNYRWQVWDDIPFKRSLKFDLEMWHWAEVEATWARTSYWYASLGSKGVHAIDVRLPVELVASKPVEGAIEGETLGVEATGGTHEVQDGFWELSGGKQRWWMDMAFGDSMTFSVPVKKAGEYEVVGNFCHAKDYGIHEIWVNGTRAGRFDFYATGVQWKRISLGMMRLQAGTAKLMVINKGSNPKADPPRRMFGLDYLLLIPR